MRSVDEQHQLVNAVKAQVHGIEAVMHRTNREIDLFREYRTRLIADVVTGQVDVGAAATSLPTDAGEAAETVEDGTLAEEDEIVEDGEALAFDGEEQ